ncbi:hypothetical protein E4T42_08532 [Aureobasidium subglaciale]|nr:hypothetical protein E4T42_08532 [Aureobasidium subglaciale]
MDNLPQSLMPELRMHMHRPCVSADFQVVNLTNPIALPPATSSLLFVFLIICYGMLKGLLARVVAEPIAQRRFDTILEPICKNKRKLGLAISGGVDSMALASLCKHVRIFNMPPVTAFIVDHRLRSESTKEAESVAELLGTLGIQHKILTLDWKDIQNPAKLSNLESVARRMRFKALGKACADADIEALLLAHHADDQAETVLSRIREGYLGTGLAGISPRSPIGECHGMYRVSRSGTPRDLHQAKRDTPVFAESGGVVIYRPLLDFTKAELVATCETRNMKWHEDATNADRTLTSRNAIRHMLQSRAMPAALSSDHLRRLATQSRANLDASEETATEMFKLCKVELDIVTSSVSFTIDPSIESWLHRETSPQLTAAKLVRKFFSLSEDSSKVTFQNLAKSVAFLFPSIMENKLQTNTSVVHLGYVGLRRAPSTQRHGLDDHSKFIIFPRPVQNPADFAKPLLEVTESTQSTSREPRWTETHIFHDRWWIRLRYVPADVTVGTCVMVRFLCKRDIAALRRNDAPLSTYAPGNIRYSIPAIVEVIQTKNKRGGTSTKESIMALPSLGWTRKGQWLSKITVVPMRFTCRYKDVEFSTSENHTVKLSPLSTAHLDSESTLIPPIPNELSSAEGHC